MICRLNLNVLFLSTAICNTMFCIYPHLLLWSADITFGKVYLLLTHPVLHSSAVFTMSCRQNLLINNSRCIILSESYLCVHMYYGFFPYFLWLTRVGTLYCLLLSVWIAFWHDSFLLSILEGAKITLVEWVPVQLY